MPDITIQHGYLVLAALSGHTSYTTGPELAHSNQILGQLLEFIVDRFKPVLTLSKFEAEIVFAYAPEAKVPRGQALVELLESTYVAFKDKLMAMCRYATCDCPACRALLTLDLRFIIHYGDYIFQTVAGITELVGSDVNLAHRLLKNHVVETTGWKAYALFTESCLKSLRAQPDGMAALTETYEHLGDTQTYGLNLHDRHKQLTETRRIFITPREAHLTLDRTYPAPPPVLWEWLNDPHRRAKYYDGQTMVAETLLDWKPFDYYTVEQKLPHFILLMTCQLLPAPDGGTRLQAHIKSRTPWLAFLGRPLLTRLLPAAKMFDRLAACIASEPERL